ncbi:MAG: type II secretion system F family protein, partial [Gammaproteobacteria bacterium]|nr:type II secretion system F family protein [Gammaproteobacteria bacterium]
MFSKFGADLPMPTKIIMGFSDFTINYWYIVIMMIFGLYYGAKRYTDTPKGKLLWHRAKLKLPVIGKILYGAALARFSRGFAITSNAGLPVVQALPLIASVIDNRYLEAKFDEVRKGVERGETISSNLKKSGVFPSTVLQMISVGEETGQLEDLLIEVSEYFEREVDYNLKGLSASIEPILIGAIGLIVLLVLLGVFLPLWGTIEVMSGR